MNVSDVVGPGDDLPGDRSRRPSEREGENSGPARARAGSRDSTILTATRARAMQRGQCSIASMLCRGRIESPQREQFRYGMGPRGGLEGDSGTRQVGEAVASPLQFAGEVRDRVAQRPRRFSAGRAAVHGPVVQGRKDPLDPLRAVLQSPAFEF